jgi:hypothetical protein
MTEAGKRLLDWSDGATDFHAAHCQALCGKPCECDLPASVAAIEAEAYANAISYAIEKVQEAAEEWGELSITDEDGIEIGTIPADANRLVRTILASLQGR